MQGTNQTFRDPMIHDLHIRVGRLEDTATRTARTLQEHSTEQAVLKTDVKYIKDGLDTIQGDIRRVFWVIIGTVVVAGTTFILDGGLTLLTP